MKPNPIPLIAACLLISLSLTAQISKDSSGNDNQYKVLLKNIAFIPSRNITTDKLNLFNRKALRTQGKAFAVIQFEKIPTIDERKQLQQSGIELLDYVSGNAYSATITGSLNTSTLNRVNVRAVVELTPEQKMQPQLAKGYFPSWSIKTAGTIDVWISFPKSFSYEAVNNELRSRNFDIVSTLYKDYRVIALRIPIIRLNELASLPFVEYVESAPSEDQPLIDKGVVNGRANVLRSSLPGGRNLRGQGVVIGIGDDADPLRHIDLYGRIINRAAIAGNTHGVRVQGIAAGAGNLEEIYTGYAPKATVIAQAFSNILAYAPAYVQDHGMVITNNSYGNIVNDCSSFGTYTLSSRILDQQAWDMPQLQNVFAAGNSGLITCSPYSIGFSTVLGDYQSAKNIIDVGNTTEQGIIAFNSSRGPVKDGRIKPEICAQGRFVTSSFPTNTYSTASGTSLSSPGVVGGLTLLYQQYRQLHSNANPKSALMKALLCNGATDLGNSGPDYTYGFGWMNLLRSVKMLEQNNYFNDSVANLITNTHSITVPANTAQLKVMLYWNDPPAAVLAAHTLVNDLDLEVTDPSSITTLPKLLDTIPSKVDSVAKTGADHINNIEQVVITNPGAGTYNIKVKGTAITQNPRQEYFLVYDTIPVTTELTYPIGAEHLNQNDVIFINWDSWGDSTNTFTVEYSIDNGSNWTTINNNVAADLRMLQWTVPSVTTDQAKVRITRNATGMVSTSKSFTIIGVPTVSLSSTQCEGYISIDWTTVSGATDYEIMMLRGDEMISVNTTASTTYAIGGLSKDSVYWVSVRARLNGNPGRRATAISSQPNSGTCSGTISNNDLKLDAILSPVSSGRKFTSTELSNSVPVTIRIKNLDDAATVGNIIVSYILNGGSPVTETIINPAIAAGDILSHSFSTNVNMSAVGSYQIQASISYSGDAITQNDSLTKTFKQLDNSAISLATAFVDNIETATSQSYTNAQIGFDGLDRYDFTNSTVYGRISTFINSGIAYSGSKALTLDADRYVASGNSDSLTGTFNLASFNAATDDIRLDFRYKNHGQISDGANNVWIRGNDQSGWVKIYDLYANQNDADGTYKLTHSIEITDSLAAYSQNFSSSFQIRWGQWGQILTADNDGGAGYSFDDIRLYHVINDVQMMSIDTPIVSSCNLSTTTPVRVTVYNSANTTISNIPVVLKIDGSVVATETISSIPGNTAIQYNFSATANLAAQGSHTVQVWVELNTDTYPDNDTSIIALINSPIINSFPYIENFESNNGSWYSLGKNNSWEYGTPASSKISRAASGSKAWKTRLAGNYNNVEKSYLYSPCFNISGITAPALSLSVALDLEDCGSGLCDGAYIEYSTDGKTWSRLGTYNQTGSTNWYNKNYSGNNLWSVQNYTRWHVVTIPLPTGLSQLRLRVTLSSDQGVNREGIAIDDIHIYDNAYGIYDGVTMGSPVSQNIPGGPTWVDFTSSGKLVASVKSPTQSMGSTEVQGYINTGSVRYNNNQYYHDRNITIKPQSGFENLSDSAFVRFYFLDSEAETLVNATGCTGCSKPASAYELGVSKYSDPDNNFENGTITDNNQGNWLFVNPSKINMIPFDKGYYAEFKVKDFSEFWLNNGGFSGNQVLPLRLISFTAQKKTNKDVIAEWVTASEFNVDRFEIEMAKGNTAYQQNQFVKIGEVKSQGNSEQQHYYSFSDVENNKSGIRYYRLKIFNNDGSFRYSIIRPIVFNEETSWQLYPNPSAGIFHLSFQANEGEIIHVRVYDVSGKIVYQHQSLSSGFVQKINIDLHESRFTSGLYLLEATVNERKQFFKLIKQ